jgi:hypothetical protein
MKISVKITFTILLITMMIAACKGAGSDVGNQPEDSGTIVCEVFYRQGAEQSFEPAPPITFSGRTEKGFHEFETMAFEAWFQDDEFEGRALSIVIVDLETDREIARQLYQFDPQNPVENQFIGGHGFTGLNYVFKSKSTDEIQFFCSIE